MTSRRGTLVEDGAREQLQIHGYTVCILPPGFNKRYPPAHLVASRAPGEKRLIRIRKISHRPSTADTVAQDCAGDVTQFRKYISRNSDVNGLRCEIWIYSLTYGFRRFEILVDRIREIQEPPLNDSTISHTKGAA